MDGQLYYPAGTSSQEKLPAVVIAHGGGMNYGAHAWVCCGDCPSGLCGIESECLRFLLESDASL